MLASSNCYEPTKEPHIYPCDEINDQVNAPPKILLVEDDPIIQIAMLGILQEYSGYDVQVAHSGEEAVALFPQGFDLVLMDVGLPGVDGIEATKRICELYPENKTPIIAHTAHGDDEVRRQCFAAGMSAFISKGDSLEVFEKVVAGAFGALKRE